MTHRRSRTFHAAGQHGLAAFKAEVDRLMSLPAAAFADVDAGALAPLVATMRATPSIVRSS